MALIQTYEISSCRSLVNRHNPFFNSMFIKFLMWKLKSESITKYVYCLLKQLVSYMFTSILIFNIRKKMNLSLKKKINWIWLMDLMGFQMGSNGISIKCEGYKFSDRKQFFFLNNLSHISYINIVEVFKNYLSLITWISPWWVEF